MFLLSYPSFSIYSKHSFISLFRYSDLIMLLSYNSQNFLGQKVFYINSHTLNDPSKSLSLRESINSYLLLLEPCTSNRESPFNFEEIVFSQQLTLSTVLHHNLSKIRRHSLYYIKLQQTMIFLGSLGTYVLPRLSLPIA